MRILASACLFACLAAAQTPPTGPIVSLNPAGPPIAVSALNFYDGSNNLVTRCQAASIQPTYTWYKSGGAQGVLTSIVVLTNVGTVTTTTAHGLAVGNRVVVAGSTTSALNGSYVIASVPSTTTFTITTSGVSNATYNNAAMTVSTTAPRSSAAIWSIHSFTYSGTNLVAEQWSEGQTAMQYSCDSRATLAYQ